MLSLRLLFGQQGVRNSRGFIVETIMQSWDAILEDGVLSSRHPISWCPPPLNVLKLNFAGSYIRAENWGGIGGVISDHDGTILRNY